MLSLNMIYIIGAVAVITLLVLVLVLRAVRARKHRAPAPTEPAFFEAAADWPTGPDTWPGDEEPPATDAEPVGDAKPVGDARPVGDAGPATDTEPADDAEPVGAAKPVGDAGPTVEAWPAVVAGPAVVATGTTTHTDAPPVAGSETLMPSITGALPQAIAMSESDPVMVLVKSLLQNSGELNPAEFRRLELYQPQRIIDAVDALTPKMTGRANESKRSRLQRIRHYAVSLTGEFEGEEKDLIPERVVMPGAAMVEPRAISRLSPPETAPVLPPEDWGTLIGGSELTLDPELSLLPDDLSPAPEAEDTPTPAPEQSADDLASMSPRELGRALGQSDDVDFKKAAIDALEGHGTPEALAQLQHSLEDPDPDVQLYALSAAERLLGP